MGRPYLFQCDPSGAYFAWKATAMGKNYVNGKTFLEKRYDEKLELEDAVHTAILTLKEGFEGQVGNSDIFLTILVMLEMSRKWNCFNANSKKRFLLLNNA